MDSCKSWLRVSVCLDWRLILALTALVKLFLA